MFTSFPSLPKVIVSRSNFFCAATALSVMVATVACIEPVSANPLSIGDSSSEATDVAQASPDGMARCQQLYGTWSRYKANSTNGSGRDIQSQVALQNCRDGHFDIGTAELERLLQADRIPVPPKQSAAAQ